MSDIPPQFDAILEQFDSKFLQKNKRNGTEEYHPDILPFVRGMKTKLEEYTSKPQSKYHTPRHSPTKRSGTTLGWFYDDRHLKKPWERHPGQQSSFDKVLQFDLPSRMTRSHAQKEYLVYKALLDMLLAKQRKRRVPSPRKKKITSKSRGESAKIAKLNDKVDQLKHDIIYGLESGQKQGHYKGMHKLNLLSEAVNELEENGNKLSQTVQIIQNSLTDMEKQEKQMLQDKEDGVLELDILETEKLVIRRKIEQQKKLLNETNTEYEAALLRFDELKHIKKETEDKKRQLMNTLVETKEDRERRKFDMMEKVANLSNEIRSIETELERLEPLWTHLHRDKLVEEQKIILLQDELDRESKRSEKMLSEMGRLEKSLKEILRSNRMSHSENMDTLRDYEDQFHLASKQGPRQKIQPLLARFTAQFYRDEYMDLVKRRLQVTNGTNEEVARLEAEYQNSLEFLSRTEKQQREKMREEINEKDRANDDLKTKQWILERERGTLEKLNQELDITLRKNETRIKSLINKLDQNPAYDPNDIKHDFSQFMVSTFCGDYLKLTQNMNIMKILRSNGDFQIIFSDYVYKLNRFNIKQKRILVITDQSIYNFRMDYSVQRHIRILDVNSMSLSRMATDVLVLHHKVDSDYLYLCTKRDEIMFHLFRLYEQCTGAQLMYQFGEHLYIADKDMYHRDIDVTKTQQKKISASSLFLPLGV